MSAEKIERKEISLTSGMPKRLKWLIHAILWSVLLAFPFFILGRNTSSVTWFGYLRFLTMLSGIVIVFYVNYLYLVKRFLFSRQIWQYIIVNLLLFTVLTVTTHFIMEMIPQEENMRPPHHSDEEFFIRFILFDYIKFMFIAALSVALKMTNSWYKAETERKELEKTRSEAELQNLKSQLNPHFLFNTLNNIYSLIAIDQDRAQEAVHELSRLLRYMLYDSSYPFVTLEKDLDFVRNYIELMRIRLPKHAELKTDIQIQSPDIRIAPLLFISLIENAFKHGVSNNKPCFIDIHIVAGQKQIKCSIRNSYFPKDEQDKSGSGIGIVNLQKRLELLYPGTHEFRCERDGDVFRSELLITLT
ncbi:MAG: sensor histidine kinase [Tannerella sp.]|jgi:sensor histidine kinase YesM|nr:sensor histidine kinase [Tannerella sp.]